MTDYTKILPKLDYSQAVEVKDFQCPECGKSGIDGWKQDKPNLVGWCDTEWGFMMIVECPHCFTKYRFHGTSNYSKKSDIGAFNHSIHLYLLAEYFANSKEFMNQ